MGCDLIDKIKGLETFDVDVTISDTIPVDIGEEDDTKVYKSITLTPKTHPDIIDRINDISGMELVRATITTLTYSGDEEISFTGKVSLGSVEKEFTGIQPSAYQYGVEYVLDLTQADLETINDDLNGNDKSITAIVDGYVSGKPVNFVLQLTLDLIVEIES
jgi:hypothetical protein